MHHSIIDVQLREVFELDMLTLPLDRRLINQQE